MRRPQTTSTDVYIMAGIIIAARVGLLPIGPLYLMAQVVKAIWRLLA